MALRLTAWRHDVALMLHKTGKGFIMDTRFVKVIFKKGGGVVAFFPELPGNNSPYNCLTYEHIGQHGSADISYASCMRPATWDEYAPLLKELQDIGYKVKIVKKFTRAALAKRKAAIDAISK